MILSHSLKFVFIKTAKVGGGSLELYLSQFLKEGERNKYKSHISARDFMDKEPLCWKKYFTFTITRHPMDRLISSYFWRNRKNKFKNFDDYLDKDFMDDNTGEGNYRLLIDHSGNLADFDFIINYENYDSDVKKVLSLLNLPIPENFPDNKSNVRKDKRPWYEFMDSDHVVKIHKRFPKEIELYKKLGYKT